MQENFIKKAKTAFINPCYISDKSTLFKENININNNYHKMNSTPIKRISLNTSVLNKNEKPCNNHQNKKV